MNTAIRTLRTMIIALAMIGMLSGIGAAIPTTTMDYNVVFDGIGVGSVDITTITPIGSDVQQVDWTNCEATGTQTGNYGNGGWMTIDRDTRIDTANNNVSKGVDGITQPSFDNAGPISGSILTWSQMNTDGGDWTPGTVFTYATLNDHAIYNSLEDYVVLDQTTKLYDGDMKVGGTADYEKILADTYIAGRLFNYGDANGTDAFNAGVVTTSDATGNVSSAISGMLSMGEMFMNVDSRLIDNETNTESSRTGFTIDVPDMSTGYTEQSTGAFAGYAAINGTITDSMNTEFTKVDNINTTGHFYALN